MKIDRYSETGYDYLFKNKRLLFSRTIGYCFFCCFPTVLLSKNSKTGYQNANVFPERVVETLKNWAPPRQVTFKCPSPPGSKGKYCGKFDCASGWQIRLNPAGRHKTAFSSQLGLWEFLRLSIGLKTSFIHFSTFSIPFKVTCYTVFWLLHWWFGMLGWHPRTGFVTLPIHFKTCYWLW